MKYLFTCFLFLLITVKSTSQNNHEFVSLTEKTNGKRIELFAVNTNNIPYDVFLMVETEDFRRSSSRPVIKTVPANSQVKMITLIKLNEKQGKYTYTLIVNEVSYDLSVRKDHSDFEIKIDDALKTKKVTLFTKDDCSLCTTTKRILETNYIVYEEFNMDKDSLLIKDLLKEYKTEEINNKTSAPILKIEDSLYTTLKSKRDLIDALKQHF